MINFILSSVVYGLILLFVYAIIKTVFEAIEEHNEKRGYSEYRRMVSILLSIFLMGAVIQYALNVPGGSDPDCTPEYSNMGDGC